MFQQLDRLPLVFAMLFAATLGLAPIKPEPHIWEKLKLLRAGDLNGPVDMFDLVLHALPWLLLMAKLLRVAMVRWKT